MWMYFQNGWTWHITLATNKNLVIKSTIKYIYSFFGISLNFNFPASAFILFFILWYKLQLSIYFPTFFVTSSYQ